MSTTILTATLGSALMALAVAPTRPATTPPDPANLAARHPTALAFAPLWNPPETQQRRMHRRRPPATNRDTVIPPSGKSTEALEREVFGTGGGGGGASTGAGARPSASVRRGPIRRDDNDNDDDNDTADGDDDDDPRGGRRAARASGNLPPVMAAHLLSFTLGTSLMGRSFKFDAPLQPDSSFPRGGLSAELESFPLLAQGHDSGGWFARLGLGASFGTEIGSAGVAQTDGGMLSYPVTARRWDIDVRYAQPLGERFLLVPRFGLGHSGYDLERRAQPAPSTCVATSTQVCFPDVHVSHVTIGFDARAALTPRLALSLGVAFLPGFGLGRGPGQLGAESDASTMGFSGALAVSWQIMDWLALRAALPVIHYGYQFSGRALPYTSASETYYGMVLGATVFTR